MVWKARTMLQTGNKGFTLFEVIVTTAILSVAILFIYEGFFVCLDSFNYCSNHLHAISWLDGKIWQAQNEITHFGSEAHIQSEGEFTRGNRSFQWSLSPWLIDSDKGLYKIDLFLNWREGKRQISLKRAAYAIYEYQEQ